MVQNRNNPKRNSTPKQSELFKLGQNGRLEPNTKIPFIRKQVLAQKAAERARIVAAKKEAKLREREQRRQEADFIKEIIKEARKDFIEKQKMRGYKGLKFIDFLRLQSNFFDHVANGYRSSADKDAIELFEQKAKILREEMRRMLNPKRQSRR